MFLNIITKLIFLVLLIIGNLYSQDYKIQFSYIPTGQGMMENDSFNAMNSIGGNLSKDISSDSFRVGAGFLKTTQSVFSEPPIISNINFPENLVKNGESKTITAIIYDLNGIKNADLFLEIGGTQKEIILPMLEKEENQYEVIIHDSLLSINSFRARVVTIDNMEYSTKSDFKSVGIQCNNSELTMASDFSYYPSGIDKDIWRLISWPSIPHNARLALSDLNEGHVFYSWDPIKNNYSNPAEIETGHSYWFRHQYKDPVIFEEDTSTTVPLEPFVIELKSGWNLIGSPFAFPVQFQKDSTIGDPITYGLPDKPNGWSGSQYELKPWNGYAIYAGEEGTITLIPFPDLDSSARVLFSEEWSLNLMLESDSFFNYSSEIGRRKHAEDSFDIFDTPLYPEINKELSLVMNLNDNKPFDYIRDIRGTNNNNGVWSLRLENNTQNNQLVISGQFLNGHKPEGLVVAMVNIKEKNISYDMIGSNITLSFNKGTSYDLKLVAGDAEYVTRTTEEIISNIPEKFSLGQNYPNPFNPITKMYYTLPVRSKVSISIYNVLGQEVKNIINKQQDYGKHMISWNGTDYMGREMASGVYFSRMTTDGFSQTKKMLLLK